MKELAAWLLTLMNSIVPATTTKSYSPESIEDRQERYALIASDLAYVIMTNPPLFSTQDARIRTAALELDTAIAETGLALDADVGPCSHGRCDNGRSACLMQIHFYDGKTATSEGWTKEDLFNDRRKCFVAGLNMLRSHLHECRMLPVEHQLASYVAGRCDSSVGQRRSEERIAIFGKMMGRKDVPKSDLFLLGADVVADMR